MVHTEAGLVPIESIKVGDKIFAQDPETGRQGYFEVVALHSHLSDEVLRVTVDDEQDQLAAEVMEITPGHPVYVEGKRWVKAEALAPGDRLRRADGGWARVLALERVMLETPQMVYNLTVQGTHIYFVLEVGVLAHNCDIITGANVNEAQDIADHIIQANSGQKVLFRGVFFNPLEFDRDALFAGKFRGYLYADQSVSQIAKNKLRRKI